MKYVEWLRDFELLDPEPKLILMEQNEFNHRDTFGNVVTMCGHMSYASRAVDLHIAWHRRMTDAYMKVRHILDGEKNTYLTPAAV